MKLRVAVLLLIMSVGVGVRPARAAAISVSAGIQINAVGDFYAPLEPYGAWVDVASYGRCFHPTRIAADWRPYTLGHWELTDVGWYWVSDEPFGWACFHYGSWIDDPQIGWVWVPGVEWSPAWVVWRESDNYIGWAPCGPNLTVAAPSLFVFVQAGHFCDPIRPSTVIVNNTTIIHNTRVVDNFRTERRSFGGRERAMRVNAGPDVSRVQRVTGRHFNPTPVATAFEQSRSRANLRGTTEQPERQRSINRTEQPDRQHSFTSPEQQRERSVTTPERPSVQEPSGAQRERNQQVTPRETQSQPAPHEAPVVTPRETPRQHSTISEPSGAARESTPAVTPHEAPVQSQPNESAAPSRSHEEHRVAAPQQSERVPVVPQQRGATERELHAAPQAQHSVPAQEERHNENERRHDQQ